MEPMNKFLNAHRQQFKDFIDSICNVDLNTPLHSKSPTYSTPLQIYSRLSGPTREGFLSLPHHIDRSRNLATLVDLWLDNYNRTATAGSQVIPRKLEGDLGRFHELCLGLRQRTNACYERVERAERHSSSLSHEWVSIAERMEVAPSEFWIKQRIPANFHNFGSNSSFAISAPARTGSPVLLSGSAPPVPYMSAMASALAAGTASQAKRGTSNERSARSSVDRRRPLQPVPPPTQEPQQQAEQRLGETQTPPLKASIYTPTARPWSKMSNASGFDLGAIGNSDGTTRPAAPSRHSSYPFEGSYNANESRPGSVSAATGGLSRGVTRSPSLRDRASFRPSSAISSRRASHESEPDSLVEARRGKHYTNAERRLRDESNGVTASRSDSRERDRSRLAGLFSRRKRIEKKDSSGNEPEAQRQRPMTSEK